MAKESSYLIEVLSGVRTVKSTAVEQTVRWHWEELLNKEVKTNFSGQVISNRLQIFSNTIEGLATTALLWFGAWLVIQNQLTIGQLVAFNMLLGQVITPWLTDKKLSTNWSNAYQEGDSRY
ncbi:MULTISPECIES: ABC transporter transmembrane domain-containing protein [unclassified Moorena]|uniref:ABC transporter transmembrane domain-containing protein n=1 Tax=unclassified Moorena TaxID=2683338 RepID=UPI0025E065A2|nr:MULTISPECIES: ABC transporter transmembrane domain-containing protein [unclassified Moorena]